MLLTGLSLSVKGGERERERERERESGNFFHWTKFKALADNILNVTNTIKSVCEEGKNVGKGENPG